VKARASKSLWVGDNYPGSKQVTLLLMYPRWRQVICKRACWIITAAGIICG
jgi:hypothetical protein